MANVRAFNRWIEEDWGFAYENRIFAPAMLSLIDLEGACQELERVLSVVAEPASVWAHRRAAQREGAAGRRQCRRRPEGELGALVVEEPGGDRADVAVRRLRRRQR